MSLDTCRNTERADYAGGFSLLSLHGAGAGAIAAFPLSKLNGLELHQRMKRYNSAVVLISFIEALPVESNRISITRLCWINMVCQYPVCITTGIQTIYWPTNMPRRR